MADDTDKGWTDLDDEQSGSQGTRQRGTGITKWSLLLLVLAISLAVILGQNTEKVAVQVLWAEFTAPLFLVVLLAALGLTVVWEIATFVLRHRRRQARAS
jgi:uncharacterized integral membrane protein